MLQTDAPVRSLMSVKSSFKPLPQLILWSCKPFGGRDLNYQGTARRAACKCRLRFISVRKHLSLPEVVARAGHCSYQVRAVVHAHDVKNLNQTFYSRYVPFLEHARFRTWSCAPNRIRACSYMNGRRPCIFLAAAASACACSRQLF